MKVPALALGESGSVKSNIPIDLMPTSRVPRPSSAGPLGRDTFADLPEHQYLAEFDFRHSNRVRLGADEVERTERAIKGIVGKRLTYRATGH
jgi:hypothetical protein